MKLHLKSENRNSKSATNLKFENTNEPIQCCKRQCWTEKGMEGEPEKEFQFKEGRFFFTRELERKIFFLLTIVMLLSGILVKIGIF